eukprot:TRINITY_DN3174_c0_g1_i1.p1 TRINITY_DN3174_c0_g1~~TRINITY_DN3174_c0_g1_i1.p1  ORF type:complete len:304 (-),score=101.85 TRINITY_DN3174_c0_g1_i1:193-1104(-)
MNKKMHPPSSLGSRKRQDLTLDLNSASNPARRKQQMQNLLTSPDVKKLKMSSPELEKFLISNPSLATPTPSGGCYFQKTVTEEQVNYVKGFEEALEQVKQADSSQSEAANTLVGLSTAVQQHYQQQQANNLPLSLPTSSSAPTTTAAASVASDVPVSPPRLSSDGGGSDSNSGVRVKEEPDDTASTGSQNYDDGPLSPTPSGSGGMDNSSMSPIDMENQEMIKLERKRMRNRMAASKCRKRKLERIAQLDERVKQLKSENADLAAVVKKMKTSVAQLKQEVMEHYESGCEIRVAETSSFVSAS